MMKTQASLMYGKICVNNTVLRVAICKECGARIYPMSFLKSHLEYHERKKREFFKICPHAEDMDEAS